MTKNLETADRIAKLTLAALTIILYLFRFISGPFAKALLIVSVIVIVLFILKLSIRHSDGS